MMGGPIGAFVCEGWLVEYRRFSRNGCQMFGTEEGRSQLWWSGNGDDGV